MTDTPDKEWIERATRAYHAVADARTKPAAITTLARELQSSFDQGVERERKRTWQFLAHIHLHLTNDDNFDADEFERDIRAVGAGEWIDTETLLIEARAEIERLRVQIIALTPTPTEGERG